jgi:hypothetical protein
MIKSPSVCKTAPAPSEGGAEYRYRLTESANSHSGPGNLAAGTGSKWASRCSLTLKALAPARGKSQLTPDVPGPGAPSGDGELPGPKEEASQAVLARRRAGPLRGFTSSSARSRVFPSWSTNSTMYPPWGRPGPRSPRPPPRGPSSWPPRLPPPERLHQGPGRGGKARPVRPARPRYRPDSGPPVAVEGPPSRLPDLQSLELPEFQTSGVIDSITYRLPDSVTSGLT